MEEEEKMCEIEGNVSAFLKEGVKKYILKWILQEM